MDGRYAAPPAGAGRRPAAARISGVSDVIEAEGTWTAPSPILLDRAVEGSSMGRHRLRAMRRQLGQRQPQQLQLGSIFPIGNIEIAQLDLHEVDQGFDGARRE